MLKLLPLRSTDNDTESLQYGTECDYPNVLSEQTTFHIWCNCTAYLSSDVSYDAPKTLHWQTRENKLRT